MTVCLQKAPYKFPFLASRLPLNKWSCRNVRARHIYSQARQDPLPFECPTSPNVALEKMLSGHFQVLADKWTGWWHASSSSTMGQNQAHRINQSRNALLSSRPAHTRSCGGCEGNKRGSCGFIAAIMSELLILALSRGWKEASSKVASNVVCCITVPSVGFRSRVLPYQTGEGRKRVCDAICHVWEAQISWGPRSVCLCVVPSTDIPVISLSCF